MHLDILSRDTLNAFCRHTHVALDGATSGPLHGLTFGLKDLYDVAGHRTGFGSPDWLVTHEPATHTASVATRLLAAGATMVGKTHTEEMAFSLSGENAHYGTPINPAAPDRIPGGSSSGSAAAVAGGLVDFAIGSDTGGSVRGPASFCGVYGIRPTHGRIALDGVCPLAPMFDTCGWFARDAALFARLGDVLLGGRAGTPGRLLVADDAFGAAMPGIADALLPAVQRMTNAYGSAEHVQLSEHGLSAWYEVFRVLQFADIWATHQEWIARVHPTFGAQIAPRFAAAAAVTSEQVTMMTAERARIRERLDALLVDRAVLVVPTMPDIAPLRSESEAGLEDYRNRAIRLLCMAGLAGLPQLSIPGSTRLGAPLGLSLVGPPGSDRSLIALAQRVLAAS